MGLEKIAGLHEWAMERLLLQHNDCSADWQILKCIVESSDDRETAAAIKLTGRYCS
jgi:hypothetical protein